MSKTHFDSKELPHKWAHQLASLGNSPGNMSFSGASFYSYGTEIARIITRGTRKAYLLNVGSYSSTTSNHQGQVSRAIPDSETKFRISGIDRGSGLHDVSGAMLFDYALKSAADAAAKMTRVRAQWQKDSLAAQQEIWIQQAQSVNEFFSLRRKVDTRAVDRLAARIAADVKRKAKAEREAQARHEQECAEYIRQWMNGEQVNFPHHIDRVMLRVKCLDIDGRMVSPGSAKTWTSQMETSKGVTVPLPAAKRAYRFACKMKATGWHRNGETFAVGEYQLDAVNEQGVVAGCHRISWEEMDRFAASQKWVAA